MGVHGRARACTWNQPDAGVFLNVFTGENWLNLFILWRSHFFLLVTASEYCAYFACQLHVKRFECFEECHAVSSDSSGLKVSQGKAWMSTLPLPWQAKTPTNRRFWMRSRFPGPGPKFFNKKPKQLMKEPCYNLQLFELWSLFLRFLLDFYLLIRPVDPSIQFLQGCTEAMRRWAAHWLGILPWPIGRLVQFFRSEIYLKYEEVYLLSLFESIWCFSLWSSCCRFVASTPTAEVLFRCERSGHFQVGSQKRFLNWTRKFHQAETIYSTHL